MRSSPSRRLMLVLGGLIALGAVGVAMSGRSVESELLGRMERLSGGLRSEPGSTTATRKAKLEESFRDVLAPGVTLALPELPLREAGPAALIPVLADALGRYQRTELMLGRVSSKVNSAEHWAVTDLEATFRGENADGLFFDRRNAVVNWVEQEGRWRVVRIYVAERDRALPEARP